MAPLSGSLDKWSMWLLLGIAVFIIFGGIYQFRSHLFYVDNKVFDPTRQKLLAQLNKDQNAALLTNATDAKNLSDLQQKDSDNDGLTDFQELYVYTTSAYISDTDSDGTPDKDEITAGTNPNCPEGQTCQQARTDGSGIATSAEDAFSEFDPSQILGVDANGQINTATLRATLKQYGVSDDVLANTDDATLLQMLQDTAAEANTNGETNSAAATTNLNSAGTIEQQAQLLRNMTTDQKRQFLVQAGAQQDEVNKLDDASLNKLFDDAINQAQSEVTNSSQ